jgi:amino acid adenylation domain-containing protein/thioester reductase-like protein
MDKQFNSKHTFLKDFFFRHHIATDQHDIAILMPEHNFSEECIAGSHRMLIVIRKTSLSILGDQQDKLLLDSICSAIGYAINELNEQMDVPIRSFSMLPPDEYRRIVLEWNQTASNYPTNKTIHQLFQEQVVKTPNDIALVFNQQSLNYRRLNEKANQLAIYIRGQYQRITGTALVGNTPIPICVDRSLEMIIGLLAIMKAGAAYVPIEPGYPAERINYILRDTDSRLLLTQTHLAHTFDKNIPAILVDAAEGLYAQEDSQDLTNYNQPNDLAYVIYTSGTTGNPKGVMVEHASVINTLWALEDIYDFDEEHKKSSCFTSFIFDVSVTEIFSSLLRGGELHLFDNDLKYSPELLSEYINNKKINFLYLPPAILGLLPKKDYHSLHAIIFAGEPCDQNVGAYWATKHKLYNYYGPTECAVYATGKLVQIRNVNEIGKPISNKTAYVLDTYLNPVAIGVIGELYIGGVGQARGYLNLPELTRERFLINHLQTESERNAGKNDRLYRTGDLVRWLPDGNLEYIGRNDFQIKIRGYRIELGEIERILSSIPKIKQSVVLVKEHLNEGMNSKFLIAFYVAEEPIDQIEITSYLLSKLPDYMVPSAFIQLKQFPTTFTGKLDRSKLLSMKIDREDRILVAPVTEIEKSVFAVWCEVLRNTQISLDDAFFQVGGNSLLAIILQTKLNAIYKLDISIVTLFQFPTIRSLSLYIASRLNTTNHQIQESDVSLSPHTISNDIAIIGMACRVPGADHIGEFWDNLKHGIESIQDLPVAKLAKIADKKYVNRAANISNYFAFDAGFFGYTPREAQSMDPQHRHFMEVVFEALEDSGCDPSSTQDLIGLYAGQGENVYFLNQIFGNQSLDNDLGDYQVRINNDKDFLTTKISYKLNLTGPSLNIQTACSTSLVAVHIAISQLLGGDCDIAVAGGVSIAQRDGYKPKTGMIESGDGRCRAFDKDSDGTIITSGVGAIVLKPLSKAIADGNHIYAIIKGSAINNDGGGLNKAGYTAPSIHGQTQVIRQALKKSNIDPATISYIEAHGTGTKIGDPIELAALHQVFIEHQRKENSIAIGSVKSNIGHTDAAAGIVGLIKTALALKQKQIPASLHFNDWNSEIKRFNKLFYVNRALTDWATVNGMPRRASVSSFGIGGTNAHVVLEEAPMETISQPIRPTQLCLVSAETESSLKGYVSKLQNFVNQEKRLDLPNLAYTLQMGRKHRKYRCYFVADHLDALKDQLAQPRIHLSLAVPNVVFMFSGQGSQYVNMAADLYRSESLFAEIIDHGCNLLKEKLSIDLFGILFINPINNDVSEQLKQTQYAQPALFIIEYAMSKLLMSFGIIPQALIGHSIGEYVAATLAGIFQFEEALLLVATRGRLMQSVKPGAMLSVQLSQEKLLSLLPRYLDLSVVNGPNLCVIAGAHSDISSFSSLLTAQNIEHAQLHTSHAFHSRMMQPILNEYHDFLAKIHKNEPQIPIISNATGAWLTYEQAKSNEYWSEHIRKPVLFHQGLEQILHDVQTPLFIEVGPGRTLATLVKQINKDVKTVHTIRHPKQKESDYGIFLQAIGELWKSGISIDWKHFHRDENLKFISLPTYCFDHKDYYVEQESVDVPLNTLQPIIQAENEPMNRLKEIWKAILGHKEIHSDHNFFELGGHSLLATQLISRIEESFDVKLEIRDVFEHPILREMHQYIEELPSKRDISPISDTLVSINSPLSTQQKALWLIQEIHGKDFIAYNEPLLFEVNGDFSIPVLQQAIQQVADRHEILRTTFNKDSEGNIYQRSSTFKIDFNKINCEKNSANDFILTEIEKSFDLQQGLLFRVRVLEIGEEHYYVLIVFHHSITDGASLRIFCRELSEAYNALVEKRAPALLPVAKQYRDYVEWQRHFFDTEEYRNKLSYWKKNLANYQELNLNQNKPRKNVFSFHGSKHYFNYDKELSLKLVNLAKQEKTTLFNIFLAGFAVLLSRYCHQDDILIGAPMLNRPATEFHNMLGFFTNTVVLRNQINSDLSFKELLRLVNLNTLTAYENQEVAFEHIVSHLNIERDPSRNPLVQVMLLLVNRNSHPQLKFNNLTTTLIDPPVHPIAKMDLTLGVFEQESSIGGYFEYSTDVFQKESVVQFAKNLQNLFATMVDHLERPIKTISIIGKSDEQTLIVDWNPNYKKRFIKGTLNERFVETARRSPNKIALKFGTQSLTYAEVDAQSNQLAQYIRARKGLFPRDTLIGICVEPSFDTIISILAVLKAGAAYVPIDPKYPTNRIEHILSDSQALLVLVQQKIHDRIPSIAALDPNRVIIVDDKIVQNQITLQPTSPLGVVYYEEDLAYVIYTSGSTGKPKGVLLPHENVLDLLYAAEEHYDFNQNDVWVLFHSFAFDVSVWEMWGTFLYGGTLVIVSYETTRDPHTFYEITKKEKITILNQTPSAFRNYIDADVAAKEKINTLRYIIFGGEALDIEMLRDWCHSHDDRHPLLVNMYGITETTVHASYQALSYSDLAESKHGRVGVPLNHLVMYVMDEQKNLSPIGVPGELYVGGGGVARGYLNRDDLTQQRFIRNPFTQNGRLYKSGDLVRWMPDGTLEYIGRTDFQVKLRGFRIELGEIESVIMRYVGIKQCIVLMREEDNHKYLVCYFTLNSDGELLNLEKLRDHMYQSLPEYMVPSAFVRLDKIPLTVNGKVDRALLPKPDLSVMGGLYTSPSNWLEKGITKIWSELLNIEESKVSVTANYFQLGGNSLSIVKMITKVKSFAAVDLPLSTFWKSPTIRTIAKMIEGKSESGSEGLEKVRQLIINDLVLPTKIRPLVNANPAIYLPKRVLITGATGFLGSYLVNELSKIDSLKICCLIRAQTSAEARERLNGAFVQNQMPHLQKLETIQVVCGDLSGPNLGLSDSDYADLAETIDVIYHNGALVHHLYDYERMRQTNVSSTHELLKLAVTSKNKAVHYISTISIGGFDVSQKLNKPDSSWSFLELNGYLLTKWVSEQLIIEAANRGIIAHAYRPGNITGHIETGHCHPAFNYTLLKIKGFIQLGQAYFDENESFEMVPVDILAKDLVEKSLHVQNKIIFNMDNPTKIPFSFYVEQFVQAAYPINKMNSLSDWQRMLSSVNEKNALYSLRAFYDHYKWTEQPSSHSDLTHSLPDYELMIKRQIKFLEKTGFIERLE